MKHSALCGGLLSTALIGLLGAPSLSGSVKDTRERLTLAATVMGEIMRAPDKGIPDEMLQAAHCVVVVPGMKKGAFIVSGQYGKGFVTCRRGGSWSSPAAIRVEGGGVGFQIGGSETDVVMLVMNERGATRLMSSQFTLGGEGEVAAGPVGRHASAETDGKFTAEILSWSRRRGVFAEVALKGATLRSDEGDNEDLYGKKLSTKEVIDAKMPIPPAGRPLIRLLSRNSPAEKK